MNTYTAILSTGDASCRVHLTARDMAEAIRQLEAFCHGWAAQATTHTLEVQGVNLSQRPRDAWALHEVREIRNALRSKA